jgi:hypothetical protein
MHRPRHAHWELSHHGIRLIISDHTQGLHQGDITRGNSRAPNRPGRGSSYAARLTRTYSCFVRAHFPKGKRMLLRSSSILGSPFLHRCGDRCVPQRPNGKTAAPRAVDRISGGNDGEKVFFSRRRIVKTRMKPRS